MADELAPEESKSCPSCGKAVHVEALFCRFCRHDFRPPEEVAAPLPAPPPPPAKSSGKAIWLFVGIGCAVLAVPVIGIVAAIAIPGLLASQRNSNERNALVSLKTISVAEFDFRSNDRDGNAVEDYWTADVRGLYAYPGPGGQPVRLIEPSIAEADAKPAQGDPHSMPKAGYWFVAMKRDEQGRPYDVKEGRNRSKYGFCAYPSRSGAGRKTFIVNEEGVIWKKDGSEAVLDWPKDPAAAGWQRLD